jgi:ABC-type Zn2+ transport system substrate-binding protein/surface adhesin
MYSEKNKMELIRIENMVYGNVNTQDKQLSIPDRVKELFLRVFGHTRNSKTLKLGRQKKKYTQRKNKMEMKKKNREQKKRVHKLRSRALSVDLLNLHNFLMDDLNAKIQAAVTAALAANEARFQAELAAALEAQEARFQAELAAALEAQEARFQAELAAALEAQEARFQAELEANEARFQAELAANEARLQRALAEAAAVERNLRTQIAHLQSQISAGLPTIGGAIHRSNLSCTAQARMFTWWH